MIDYLIILGIIVVTSLIAANPAYAEVRTFSLEKSSYTNDELVTFVGVEKAGKKSVFVTIRGPGGDFVGMFSDPASDSDGSFSTIPRSVEDFFKSQGIYTATAFTDDQNEKDGKTIQLEYDGGKLSVNDDFESTQPKISIFAKTELPSYESGDRVVVTGSITNFDYSTYSDIALSYRVLDNTGNIVTLGQTLPNPKGVFSFDFVAGGSLFKLSGDYPIQLIFGSVNDEISMTYTGGEFQSALPPGPSSTLPPTFNPRGLSDAIITITIIGDSIFYLDSPNAIIRGNVEIFDFSPSDGYYFMKVTHLPTQKVLKDFEIYPKYSGNDLWSVQIAYPILDTDIQFGGQTLYGEFQIEVTSEYGGQTGSTSFFIFESSDYSIINIPEWVKNNAKWWADGLIDDKTFVSGIQFLIKEKILNIPTIQSTTQSSTNSQVPEWIKTNADWWARGLITDGDFLKGIEYLVKNNIIDVSEKSPYAPKVPIGPPIVQIQMDQLTYTYGESLVYTIQVTEVTGDLAIVYIRDDSGKGSSAIPIEISKLKTEVPSPYPFDKQVFPEGKYFIDVEYSGAKHTVEFYLIN